MKRPTWGTVIGILMIVFGCFGVLKSIQSIGLPAKLEEAKAKHEKKERQEASSSDTLAASTVDSTKIIKEDKAKFKKEVKFDLSKNVLEMPIETKAWIIRFGYMGILVSILYAIGGIYLLLPKTLSIKLAYGMLILSIAFTGFKTIILLSPSAQAGVIGLALGGTQVFSIIIDIILLSVIFSSENKEYYTT